MKQTRVVKITAERSAKRRRDQKSGAQRRAARRPSRKKSSEERREQNKGAKAQRLKSSKVPCDRNKKKTLAGTPARSVLI